MAAMLFASMWPGAGLGCGGPDAGSCPPNPCPPIFSVDNWCGTAGMCAIAGKGWPVDGPDRQVTLLEARQTLAIPIGQFVESLGGAHDLFIRALGLRGDVEPDSAGFDVRLDGVRGRFVEDYYAEWNPFPASPRQLDIGFSAGAAVEVGAHFLDRTCETTRHPACPQ